MDTSDYEQSIEISIHALREEGDWYGIRCK